MISGPHYNGGHFLKFQEFKKTHIAKREGTFILFISRYLSSISSAHNPVLSILENIKTRKYNDDFIHTYMFHTYVYKLPMYISIHSNICNYIYFYIYTSKYLSFFIYFFKILIYCCWYLTKSFSHNV